MVLSRRDRAYGENRGGILTLARRDVKDFVHLFNAIEAERSWHYLYFDAGIIALGNWFRPPAVDDLHIITLRQKSLDRAFLKFI